MTLQTTASRLLRKHGRAVVFSYDLPGTRDPATGEQITPPSAVTLQPIFGYPGVYRPSLYKEGEVVNTDIRSSDIRLLMENPGAFPQPGWRALLNGRTYRVMASKDITDGAVDVIYVCQLRLQ